MTENGRRLTKNEKKRLKKKDVKNNEEELVHKDVKSENHNDENNIEIQYVSADIRDIVGDDSLVNQFKEIFDKFTKAEELTLTTAAAEEKSAVVQESSEKPDATQEEVKKLSKKKRKLLSRLTVAQLKQLVPRPDCVEAHDVTSSDPRLLVYLKAYRNTVPVPRHWCSIRQYLQGKRGIEKPPFQLPDFIAETGIAKIRDTVMEQEALKKSKQKARDRLQPKTGKIDIDYQVLHDAFFKYQTKPKVTKHGDLYYEGKEFEVHMKEMKPGIYSPELMAAVGMADSNSPPPWLVSMQRYGPPPSYPNMRIPGLSAPIPAGAQFGYHTGGWGKPPVDEYGRPLYGDVFGTVAAVDVNVEEIDKASRWGEITKVESESEDESEEEPEEEETGAAHPVSRRAKEDISGMETPSTMDGISTINSGLETPDVVDLRKRAGGSETPDSQYSMGGPPRELYTVIQEKAAHSGAKGQLFGSDRTYVLPGKGDVVAAMNPEDADNSDRLQEMYESGGRGDGDDGGDEDAKGKRKRRLDSSNVAKRYKDFKF